MFIEAKLLWNVFISAKDFAPNSLMLRRAILVRLLEAFASKKATKDLGYFVALKNLEEIAEGKIKESTGEIMFPVVFNGITFKLFKGEILHGVVTKVFRLGVLLRCGPCENVYLSNHKMPGYKFIPGDENPVFVDQNMSRIEINATVRFVVIATEWMEAECEFRALASLEGDNLGPF